MFLLFFYGLPSLIASRSFDFILETVRSSDPPRPPCGAPSVRLLGVCGLLAPIDGFTGMLGRDTDLTGGSSFTELKEEA